MNFDIFTEQPKRHYLAIGEFVSAFSAVELQLSVLMALIRGREQDAVNAYGLIGSSQLGNSINPIWQYNPNWPLYMGASSLMFGPYVK